MRALAACLLCCGLAACRTRIRVDGPLPRDAHALPDAHAALCLVEPPDGGTGASVYVGSGREVADRVAHAVEQARGTPPLRIGKSQHADPHVARRCAYAIVPTIVEWQRRDGPVFHGARLGVDVALERSGSREVVRTIHFEMSVTRPNVLYGRVVLSKEFDEAVRRLVSVE